jgi:uncharacterized membrane protein
MSPQGLTDTAKAIISNYINKENNKHMSTLVVVGYDDPYKAEEVRLKLRKLHSEYLLDLEDVVVTVKDEKGKVKLHQSVNVTPTARSATASWDR